MQIVYDNRELSIKNLLLTLLLCSACFGVTPSITSYTTGQVTPFFEARSDSPKYNSANRTLENMLVYIEGPATRRPGTRYIGQPPGTFEDAYAAYEMTYISENGEIWGVPLNYSDYTTLTLSVGDARHISGTVLDAVVGLPCTGHPFASGDVIWIEGTNNYDMTHTLTSDTSVNELVFEDNFNDETFDGTETVVQYMYLGVELGASEGRMDMDETGNLYFGYNDGVAKISLDGTIDDSFFSPGDAFSGACLGVKVTSGSDYIYICFDSHKLYKFDLSDGSEEWQVSTGTVDNYDIDVDDDDNVYVCNASSKALSAYSYFYSLRKFAAADGDITTFDYLPSKFSVVVDDDMGRVICGSHHYWREVDTAYYQGNLFLTDLNGENQVSTQLGTPAPVGVFDLYYGPTIGTGNIVTYNNYIYVLCSGRIYKLNTDLVTKKSITAPTYATGLFVDLRGHIVVVCQDWSAAPQDEIFLFYDTDLNYLDKIGGFSTSMLRSWDAAVGGAYIQGNVAFYPGLSVPETNYYVNADAQAIRLIPFEYSTDDSYVLALGSKYIGFYRTTE